MMLPRFIPRSDGGCWQVRRAWPAAGGRTTAELVDPAAPDRIRAGHWTVDEALQVLPFGTDPKLPALRATLDGADSADGRLLVHRFGRRAVVRTPSGYTKVLRPRRAGDIAKRHRAGCAALGNGIRVPGVVAETGATITVDGLPGMTLTAVGHRADTAELARAWSDVGSWLARISERGPGDLAASLPEHTPGDEARIVAQWIDRLTDAEVLSGTDARALRDLADRVQRNLVSGDAGLRASAHRDLHDGQLLWDGDELGVIDLDTAAVAEPALDLGNLLAHLELRARQAAAAGPDEEGLAPPRAEVARRALLDAVDPTPEALRRVRVYQTASALRLVAVYAWRPRWRSVALDWVGDLVHESSLIGVSS